MRQKIYAQGVVNTALEPLFLAQESSSQRSGSGGAVPRPRIQSLSDLIFGLALSIGALTLVGQQPTSTQQLGLALGLYGFSFLILIRVWQLYSSVTSVLQAETSLLVNLNIILLFFVSVEPYRFNELFALGGTIYSSVSAIYAADLAAMFLILAFFTHSLVDEEKNLIPKYLLHKYRVSRNLTLFVALMFVVSLAPFMGDTSVLTYQSAGLSYDLTLRSIVWIATLFVGLVGRALGGTGTPVSAQS